MMHQHTGQGRVNMCLHTGVGGGGNTIHPLSTTTSITTFTSKAGSTINMEEDTISQPPFPSKPKHLNQEIFPQQRIRACLAPCAGASSPVKNLNICEEVDGPS